MKLLLYCTKAKPYLYNVLGKYIISEYLGKDFMQDGKYDTYLNGKIVGECDFEVEEILLYDNCDICTGESDFQFKTKSMSNDSFLKQSCLTDEQLDNYLLDNCLRDKIGYAIHIKNLTIFDEPRDLSDVGVKGEKVGDTQYFKTCEKAPQNMMYVLDGVEKKILISIRPEWLCKILNGEKTIEVRRKVLKEMISNE